MTNVTGMFAEEQRTTTGARSLAGTAQLTNVAETITADIMQAIEADFVNLNELLNKSKVSHEAMDTLINQLYDMSTVDVQFLRELDEQTIEGMLKSQQSKRSRSKSKAMTLDNYKAMMTGAVAEALIRLITGKKKSAGARRVGTSYSEDELKELANDQEALRKEIRNVQSKKSIMKSKADFSEESEEWVQLLDAEKALKDLRATSDATKNALQEMLKDVSIDELKAADAKDMLKQILELVS